MKAKIDRMNLVEASKKAAKAIRGNIIGVGECLRLDIDGDILYVTGISHEMTIKVKTDTIEYDEEFAAIVNANLFFNIISKMVSSDVILIKNKAILTVRGGSVKLDIPCMNEDMWPVEKTVQTPAFEITTDFFGEPIDKCAHSLPPQTIGNAIMSSFYVEFTGSKLRMTTLDGHRISTRDNYDNANTKVSAALLIDGSCMKEISKLAGKEVIIKTEGDMVTIISDDVTVHTKMPHGNYFNVSQFTGFNVHTKVRLNRLELLNAIELAGFVYEKVMVEITENGLNLSSKKVVGELNTTVPAEVTGSDLFTICFDCRLMVDALKSIDDEIITLELINKLSPVYIRGEGYMELILPVRYAE